MDNNLSKLQERVEDRGAWCAAVSWGGKESDMTQRLNNKENTSLPFPPLDSPPRLSQGHTSPGLLPNQ